MESTEFLHLALVKDKNDSVRVGGNHLSSLFSLNVKGQSPDLAKKLMSESVSQLLYSSDSCELQFRLRLWIRRRRWPLMVVYRKAHWEKTRANRC